MYFTERNLLLNSKEQKKLIGHRTRFRENGNLPLPLFCLHSTLTTVAAANESSSWYCFKVKRKTKELLPELLSAVPSLANCEEDKRIGESALQEQSPG